MFLNVVISLLFCQFRSVSQPKLTEQKRDYDIWKHSFTFTAEKFSGLNSNNFNHKFTCNVLCKMIANYVKMNALEVKEMDGDLFGPGWHHLI